MTLESLIAMGLTEDQAKQVMTALDGNYITKTRFNEVNEELKNQKAAVSERDKQLEELKKSSGDNEELKNQIAELQKQNQEQQTAHEAEIAQLKMDNAVEAALTAAGAKNAKAVRALLDETSFKLNDKGEVEGLKKAVEAVQKSDSYLFEDKSSSSQSNNFTGFQPGASGDTKPNTNVDVSKMTYSEMVSYLETHPDAKIS